MATYKLVKVPVPGVPGLAVMRRVKVSDNTHAPQAKIITDLGVLAPLSARDVNARIAAGEPTVSEAEINEAEGLSNEAPVEVITEPVIETQDIPAAPATVEIEGPAEGDLITTQDLLPKRARRARRATRKDA